MICENLEMIRAAIARAAGRCNRDPESIELVAVSKRMTGDRISAAVACGQTIFGENYLQEARVKIESLPSSLRWHFIGHLQSNKAREAVRLFDLIETVDRLKLARALDRYAGQRGHRQDVLVQVNVGREPQKSGVLPENAEQLLSAMAELDHLRILGLMTMPPRVSDPEQSRPWFRALRRLARQLAERGCFADNDRVELSMGMSADFAVAIEEGATMVRVGTAIFGRRP
ncbi:MAG TPA: YggS family pyridoxal phosphate-dependent enzyme [Desulfobulbus sp.]|nr:YggS family pyridoxal phosphate-dependent enzyme [Desulfobulbus sp.]